MRTKWTRREILELIVVLIFVFTLYNTTEPGNGGSSGDRYTEDTTVEAAANEEEKVAKAEEEMIEEYVQAQLDKEQIEKEISEAEATADEADGKVFYYIDNGYYFHDDIDCKGLDGYRDEKLNRTDLYGLSDHPELSPCNWCTKRNSK